MIYRRLWFAFGLVPGLVVTVSALIASLIYYFTVENPRTRCMKSRKLKVEVEVDLKTLQDHEDIPPETLQDVSLSNEADQVSLDEFPSLWKWRTFFAVMVFDITWLMFDLIVFDHVMFAWGFPLISVFLIISWVLLLPGPKNVHWRRNLSLGGLKESIFWKAKNWKVLFWSGIIAAVVGVFVITFFTEGVCITSSPNSIDTRFSRRFKTNFCEASDSPCHVYLTYAEDPARTIFVNFHTSSPNIAAPRVYFDTVSRSELNYAQVKPARSYRYTNRDIDRGIHWAYLENLTPDTVYYFRAGYGDDDDKFSEEFSFVTAPAAGAYNFVVGGDVSITELSKNMSKQAASTNPLFAVVGGDIEYSNGFESCYRRMDEFVHNWQTLMVTSAGRMIPMVLAIGNHEVGGFGAYFKSATPFFLRWFPQAAAHDDPTTVGERSSYHLHKISDSTSFLVLDSDVMEAPDGPQLDWMKETLVDALPAKFAVYHAPLYPSHRPYEGSLPTKLRESWLPTFDAHNLTVGFENHDHMYKRSKLMRANEPDSQGTLYIGDGSWGVDTRAEDHVPTEKEWYLDRLYGKNYVLTVRVEGSEVNVTAIDNYGEAAGA
eukprot:TRINITY_DN3406_c0_g1_i1.p1 TRINITY_DN3406_c0_g1~~TRINITY_DN3406_c0_g1_i1.p1  ORF type:complete len:600 (-),score=112.85 TRINITY_DN3406_c0_g1_i1:147-1946(-)